MSNFHLRTNFKWPKKFSFQLYPEGSFEDQAAEWVDGYDGETLACFWAVLKSNETCGSSDTMPPKSTRYNTNFVDTGQQVEERYADTSNIGSAL